MIPSPNHSARRGGPVRLVVVHTAEGSRTVESLGSWFSSAARAVSSHAGIDDRCIETYVPYDRAAWTLRSGNGISDNVELCGFARWDRDEWMQHGRMLELTAQWIRERCRARDIPIRKLTPEQVKAGQAGVCGHLDWTVGMRDGTHTDPGGSFPWEHVIALAGGGPADGPDALPTLRRGDSGPEVESLQRFLNATDWTPDLPLLPVTGNYLDQTTAVVKAAQEQCGVTGPDANGTICGPRTNRAFWAKGYRG